MAGESTLATYTCAEGGDYRCGLDVRSFPVQAQETKPMLHGVLANLIRRRTIKCPGGSSPQNPSPQNPVAIRTQTVTPGRPASITLVPRKILIVMKYEWKWSAWEETLQLCLLWSYPPFCGLHTFSSDANCRRIRRVEQSHVQRHLVRYTSVILLMVGRSSLGLRRNQQSSVGLITHVPFFREPYACTLPSNEAYSLSLYRRAPGCQQWSARHLKY